MARWKQKDEDVTEGALQMREWKKTKAGKAYAKKHAEYAKEWRRKNKEKFHANQKACYDKVRLEALTHYSAGTPKCACCAENGLVFLSIDHINGKGHEERTQRAKELGYTPGGNSLVYWLKKNNWPEGYQILCYNCNFAKRNNAECPHKTGMTHKTIIDSKKK